MAKTDTDSIAVINGRKLIDFLKNQSLENGGVKHKSLFTYFKKQSFPDLGSFLKHITDLIQEATKSSDSAFYRKFILTQQHLPAINVLIDQLSGLKNEHDEITLDENGQLKIQDNRGDQSKIFLSSQEEEHTTPTFLSVDSSRTLINGILNKKGKFSFSNLISKKTQEIDQFKTILAKIEREYTNKNKPIPFYEFINALLSGSDKTNNVYNYFNALLGGKNTQIPEEMSTFLKPFVAAYRSTCPKYNPETDPVLQLLVGRYTPQFQFKRFIQQHGNHPNIKYFKNLYEAYLNDVELPEINNREYWGMSKDPNTLKLLRSLATDFAVKAMLNPEFNTKLNDQLSGLLNNLAPEEKTKEIKRLINHKHIRFEKRQEVFNKLRQLEMKDKEDFLKSFLRKLNDLPILNKGNDLKGLIDKAINSHDEALKNLGLFLQQAFVHYEKVNLGLFIDRLPPTYQSYFLKAFVDAQKLPLEQLRLPILKEAENMDIQLIIQIAHLYVEKNPNFDFSIAEQLNFEFAETLSLVNDRSAIKPIVGGEALINNLMSDEKQASTLDDMYAIDIQAPGLTKENLINVLNPKNNKKLTEDAQWLLNSLSNMVDLQETGKTISLLKFVDHLPSSALKKDEYWKVSTQSSIQTQFLYLVGVLSQLELNNNEEVKNKITALEKEKKINLSDFSFLYPIALSFAKALKANTPQFRVEPYLNDSSLIFSHVKDEEWGEYDASATIVPKIREKNAPIIGLPEESGLFLKEIESMREEIARDIDLLVKIKDTHPDQVRKNIGLIKQKEASLALMIQYLFNKTNKDNLKNKVLKEEIIRVNNNQKLLYFNSSSSIELLFSHDDLNKFYQTTLNEYLSVVVKKDEILSHVNLQAIFKLDNKKIVYVPQKNIDQNNTILFMVENLKNIAQPEVFKINQETLLQYIALEKIKDKYKLQEKKRQLLQGPEANMTKALDEINEQLGAIEEYYTTLIPFIQELKPQDKAVKVSKIEQSFFPSVPDHQLPTATRKQSHKPKDKPPKQNVLG